MKTDNELIAEFHDGTKFNKKGFCTDRKRFYSWSPGCYEPLKVEHLMYDENWGWLMPVVEKISQLDCVYSFDIHVGATTAIHSEETFEFIGGDLQSTYKCVVKFIKWYNENKEQ